MNSSYNSDPISGAVSRRSAARRNRRDPSDPLMIAQAINETIIDACAKFKDARPRRALAKAQRLLKPLRNADAFLFDSYTQPTSPSDGTHRIVASHHHHAYETLAHTFLVVFDASWTARNWPHAIDAATAALNCLKNALLINFLANTPGADRHWTRTHHIFRLISGAPLAWTRKHAKEVETILNLYKHIMLLGIAQPRYLTPPEILELDRELKRLAPFAHILPAQLEWDRQHAFLIHTSQDTIPRRYSPSRNFGDTQLWLLDTRDVVARLRLFQHPRTRASGTWLIGGKSDDTPTELTPEKIDQLIRSWQGGERRATRRERKPTRIWLTNGLVRTFDALCASTRSHLLGEAVGDDAAAASQRAAIWRAARPMSAALHTVSDGGMGILLQARGDAALPEVGDILGVFTDGTTGQAKLFGLAAVTWLRPRDEHWWACGVSLLSELAVPLALQCHTSVANEPALLLPARALGARTPRLVTLPHHDGSTIVELNDGRHAQAVKLDRHVAKQAFFHCYEFAPHAAVPPVDKTPRPSNVTPIRRRPGRREARLSTSG